MPSDREIVIHILVFDSNEKNGANTSLCMTLLMPLMPSLPIPVCSTYVAACNYPQ